MHAQLYLLNTEAKHVYRPSDLFTHIFLSHNLDTSNIAKEKHWTGLKLHLIQLCSTQKYLNITLSIPKVQNGYKATIA